MICQSLSSYYYDDDTGFYYLQSRYYDPANGRFINADALVSTGQGVLGGNMFAYCRNNPVKRKDVTGTSDVCEVSGVDDGILDDLLNPDGSGGYVSSYTGYAYAENPIDAGYTYYPDYSFQTYSSLYTGGFYQNGYDFVETYSPSACFIAGTLVQSEHGAIAIEDISVGDMVWAWDETTGDVALKEVIETYINESDELIHVFVNGEEIITTPNHPFYSPVKGWTAAAKLRAGDILVTVNGEYVVIEKVQHEILEAPITVYNFQVEGYHTYYVANAGILVHNDCPITPRQTPDQRALLQLAREVERNARKGIFISYQEAQLLDEWALEYSVPQGHSALIGSGSHWRTGWDHTHIYNVHVPFISESN